jgi:hypothetical protein
MLLTCPEGESHNDLTLRRSPGQLIATTMVLGARMKRFRMRMSTLALVAVGALSVAVAAFADGGVLRVMPPNVNFGTKPVGSFTLKGATVTNASSTTINLLVTVVAEPDDFSVGILPGSTCPVFAPAALAPGESCDAVVGFRPTDFFAGQQQVATLAATATDPASGAVVDTQLIDFSGRGK